MNQSIFLFQFAIPIKNILNSLTMMADTLTVILNINKNEK